MRPLTGFDGCNVIHLGKSKVVFAKKKNKSPESGRWHFFHSPRSISVPLFGGSAQINLALPPFPRAPRARLHPLADGGVLLDCYVLGVLEFFLPRKLNSYLMQQWRICPFSMYSRTFSFCFKISPYLNGV